MVKISLLLCCWLACLALLAACGPEAESNSNEQQIADTQQIALDFQASNNLDEARNRLSQLNVANPSQWLVFVTEGAIADNADPNTTLALVKLAMQLGLESTDITRYATANNLLGEPPGEEPVANVAVSQPVNPPTTTTSSATGNQPVVAPVAQPAPISSTLVLTVAAAPSTTVALTATSLLTTGNPPTTTTPAAAAVAIKPVVKAKDIINVRSGPGTEYDLVGALQSGESAPILAKSPTGDWWQVTLATGQNGWVYGQLVEPGGDLTAVAVAANIPAPPPPTATPAAPAEQPAQQPAATPTPPPANPNDTPHFTLVAKRMWAKSENGECRGQHLLRLHVIDANGIQLNGVTLEGVYTGEKIVTGSQGKGDGIMEYDLYHSGEDFKVITNNDGRPATSDVAGGFTTRSADIDEATLIAGGYCSNHDDCQVFYNSHGCQGHHSWEATLKRNY